MASPAIPITGDTEADLLLQNDPLALLLGMLLDQQVPMEWAFKGPHTLQDRLGGELAAAEDARQRPEDDAEREQRHHEGERHRAGHGEPAVLIKTVDGFQHGAVTLHSGGLHCHPAGGS